MHTKTRQMIYCVYIIVTNGIGRDGNVVQSNTSNTVGFELIKRWVVWTSAQVNGVLCVAFCMLAASLCGYHLGSLVFSHLKKKKMPTCELATRNCPWM